jgi:hypothetical protein
MEISLFLYTLIYLGDASSEGFSLERSILGDGFDTIFIFYFVDEDSSKVTSFICFLGFLFLAPISLPCFMHGIDLFVAILDFFFVRDFNSRLSICS